MQQGNELEGCFKWLLRVSETMMKHISQLGSMLLQSANLLGSSICMPSLDVTSDCTVAYSAIVLASCLGHHYHATPSHQSFSKPHWHNTVTVLPHIHTGPVKIFTVLNLNKQLPA